MLDPSSIAPKDTTPPSVRFLVYSSLAEIKKKKKKSDSVDSYRNFVTHALPKFGEDACAAVAQEHIITPLHVVLWTKEHNSSYIHYNTPSKTHQGGFRLCVVIDFTIDTELSSTSIVNNRLKVFCSGLS